MLFRRSPSWDAVDYWALDLETTGLEPRRDRILSVGMLPVRRGAIVWGERFYSLTRPDSLAGLDARTMAVHHILPEELAAAPSLAAVLPEVLERLGDAVLLVHHAGMDVPFLERACAVLGLPWPRPKVVDTQRLVGRLAHRLDQLDPYGKPLPGSLGGVRERLGLPSYDYHHALTDALATAELFLVLRARLGAKRLRQLR